MKHLIHTGFRFTSPDSDILGKVNKIKHINHGLEVYATMDTEKFKEDLDAWIKAERHETEPETEKSLKMKVEILDTSNPYRGQFNYETLSKLRNFVKNTVS